MKILVFGNPLVEDDSLPLKILPKLKKIFPEIEFIEVEPTEGLEKFGRDLVIIDVVKGIKKVQIINSVEVFETTRVWTMHDFDLACNLRILKKLNLIDSVKIIGIPTDIEEDEVLREVGKLLKN